MNTTAPRSSHHTASWIVRVTVALASALAVILGSAAASQAYTVNTRANVGTPPTIYRVVGSHQDIGTPASPQWMRQVAQSGPVVRHTAAGNQNVQLAYTVYRYNGSAWAVETTLRYGRNFSAGAASLKMPSLSYGSTTAGYFLVRVTLTWNTMAGARQSTYVATMNSAGDSVCSTNFQCTASGWIYLS